MDLEPTPIAVAPDAEVVTEPIEMAPPQIDIEEITRTVAEKVRADSIRQERLATILAVEQMERGNRLSRHKKLED